MHRKLIAAGSAVLIAEPVLALAHMGGIGAIVGLAIGAAAYCAVDELEQSRGGETTSPPNGKAPEKVVKPEKPSLAYRIFNGRSTRADAAEQTDQKQNQAEPEEPDIDGNIDALFHAQSEAEQDIGIPRLVVNDIVRHTQPDSYQVCIGRSLTRRGNPPVFINFYGQHLKLIGASQYGKSSMAAAILYLISRTHSPDNVLIALLDMENKTSKLFADLPHLAEVDVNGEPVLLHARTRDEVLEYLRYIVAVMDERYSLSEREVEREPILLVYLEEFLALKDYFKRLVDSTQGEAREQAKRDYAQLVFNVSEIARRGLKVKVQLLMCAQVDYRDDDFQEALINVTGGMSFCVRTTAAAAAGFTRTDLLKRNVEEDKRGQAVVETPDCKDLVLAPEFDLKKRLLIFERRQQETQPRINERRTSILTARGGQPEKTPVAFSIAQEGVTPQEQEPVNPNHRRLTSLHHQALEHYRPGIGYRPLGELIGVGKDKAGELVKDLKKWGFIEEEAE